MDKDQTKPISGNVNVPDLSTSGEYYKNNPDKFKEGMSKVGEKLKSLFKNKFTENKAQDKLF